MDMMLIIGAKIKKRILISKTGKTKEVSIYEVRFTIYE